MDLGLKNQNVIVFGSTQGIGKAIADAFAGEGARVCRADLKPDGSPDSAEVDIAEYDSVMQLTDRIGEEWGGIDHVICAAAIGSGKFGFPFWNLDPSDWQSVLDVSLMGTVHVAHAASPWLRKGDTTRKSMLFLASVAGQIGSQTDPPYSAAKAGVINFAQGAAKDFARYGVRVNTLSPGMVKTELNESVWASSQKDVPESQQKTYEEWAAEKIGGVSPMGRWQTPPEYGAMAVYLASDHARNITGQTINIDGGQVMHS